MSSRDDQTASRAKVAAARHAAEQVEDGMLLGLGTGSTADAFLEALARRIREEGLAVRGIPTSEATARRAEELEIPLARLAGDTAPDLVVDGTDEVDGEGRLIKGGGGALVREKLVASRSARMAVILHWEKEVETLGAFPLPVAVLPFGWEATAADLSSLGARVSLRSTGDGPLRTDDGLHIVDCAFGAIPDPEQLEQRIRSVPGVVASGLFLGLATELIVGERSGDVRVRRLS